MPCRCSSRLYTLCRVHAGHGKTGKVLDFDLKVSEKSWNLHFISKVVCRNVRLSFSVTFQLEE